MGTRVSSEKNLAEVLAWIKLLITTVRMHPFLIYSLDYGSVVLYVVRTNVEVGGCFTRAIVRSGFCVSNEKNSTKTTTTTIGNEFDRSSRSEGSPTREVYTGALLIICRRLSSSREESSLERFFFSLLLSFLFLHPSSLSSFSSLLCMYNLASLHFFSCQTATHIYEAALGFGVHVHRDLRIEFWSLVYFEVILNLYVSEIYCLQGILFQDSNLRTLEILKFIRETCFIKLTQNSRKTFKIVGICRIPQEVYKMWIN